MPKLNNHSRTTDLSGVLGLTYKVNRKIKSIEKLLEKAQLPADVRVEKERALNVLRMDLKNTLFERRTQKRAKKYHMLRFFERKKAVRKLKQATKAHKEAQEMSIELEVDSTSKKLRKAQVEVAYVYLFPKSKKYIALYPHEPSEEDLQDENIMKGRQLTDESRQFYLKHMEKLLDLKKIPFEFEDILLGKVIEVDNVRLPGLEPSHRKEIDAPVKAAEDDEEDDFFE